ncbi:MAG TPA: hypothetical protein PKD53_24215 [Chloroflexaceae bacterium]|nr:hypothetical protein [Chloroflexaceae bacterium]
MNTRLFWQTVGRELTNTRPAGTISRIGSWLAHIVGAALALWGGSALAEQLSRWSLEEPAALAGRFGATLVALCWGLGGWAGLGALRLGLARDEQELLFTLPLQPAERWQALLVRVTREWVGVTSLVLTLAALGGALLGALGAGGLPWLLLATLGMLLSLLGGPLLMVAGAALLLRAPLPVGSVRGVADFGGRCYEALARRQRARDRAPAASVLPGLALVLDTVARRRTPAAALVWRGVVSQSRSWTFRLRLLMTPVLSVAVLWLAQRVSIPGASDAELLAMLAISLGLLTIADGAPSPLGGEGERLALLLLSPARPLDLLRGKLFALLLAVGTQTTIVSAVLGVSLGLGTAATLFVVLQVSVAVVGLAALFVGGSILDVDLTRSAEGALQSLLVEEAPVTRVRLALVACGILVAAAQASIILALDDLAAVGALALLTGSITGVVAGVGQWGLRTAAVRPRVTGG